MNQTTVTLESIDKKIDAKIDFLDKKIDKKIDLLDKKIDKKIDLLDKRFDILDHKIEKTEREIINEFVQFRDFIDGKFTRRADHEKLESRVERIEKQIAIA